MVKVFGFDELEHADLVVDAVYAGNNTPKNPITDEPISKLMACGNMGGFRAAGRGEDKRFVVLYTSGEDRDWPDVLDLTTGRFTYYGDNKTPGHELHETTRKGNQILRRVFDHLHADPPRREQIPPFFIFAKHPTATSSRSVRFLGVAAPGSKGVPGTEDLAAIWKTTAGERFQNYRALFSVLNVPVVSRGWLAALAEGDAGGSLAPEAWQHWVKTGEYRNLSSEPTTVIRSVEEQTPDTSGKREVLSAVFEHFKAAPHLFESFAAHLFQLSDQRVVVDEITRGAVDGGRDAIGRYRLGLATDPVWAEFSLEAKCYQPPLGDAKANSVGVKEVSRLISRIRHRQFGVLVTTSVIAAQAYREVRDDRHPIVFLCGRDIAETLIHSGYTTKAEVKQLLCSQFPVESP